MALHRAGLEAGAAAAAVAALLLAAGIKERSRRSPSIIIVSSPESCRHVNPKPLLRTGSPLGLQLPPPPSSPAPCCGCGFRCSAIDIVKIRNRKNTGQATVRTALLDRGVTMVLRSHRHWEPGGLPGACKTSLVGKLRPPAAVIGSHLQHQPRVVRQLHLVATCVCPAPDLNIRVALHDAAVPTHWRHRHRDPDPHPHDVSAVQQLCSMVLQHRIQNRELLYSSRAAAARQLPQHSLWVQMHATRPRSWIRRLFHESIADMDIMHGCLVPQTQFVSLRNC